MVKRKLAHSSRLLLLLAMLAGLRFVMFMCPLHPATVHSLRSSAIRSRRRLETLVWWQSCAVATICIQCRHRWALLQAIAQTVPQTVSQSILPLVAAWHNLVRAQRASVG